MKQACPRCADEFKITADDQLFYQKLSVPEPTLCPRCRLQRRMAWRNERKLYSRTCDACQRAIISMYSPDKKFTVFCPRCWWGDSWDAFTYAQDIDLRNSFIQQFDLLHRRVPHEAVVILNCENCDYNNMIRDCKNCFMCSLVANNCEQIFYGYWIVNKSFKLVDCAYGFGSELCYDCLNIANCYGSLGLVDCVNTAESMFCYNLIGCSNCILCSDLRNQEYCIENKKVTSDKFEQRRAEILLNYTAYNSYRERFRRQYFGACKRASNNIAVENCSGNNLKNSKNCFHCFDGEGSEDLRYVTSFGNVADSMDCYAVGYQRGELLYDSLVVKGNNRVLFSNNITSGTDVYYSAHCVSCTKIFGCVGLRNAEHCILNKQYSKADYEYLVPKIISYMASRGEWGEFFPEWVSPFGYNETVASQDFPLTRSEALESDFNWSDYEPVPPHVTDVVESSDLPERIEDVSDDILGVAVRCARSRRPYRIVQHELEFYRAMRIPLPRLHPDERFADLLALRPMRKLQQRQCRRCKSPLLTAYSTEFAPEIECDRCFVERVR